MRATVTWAAVAVLTLSGAGCSGSDSPSAAGSLTPAPPSEASQPSPSREPSPPVPAPTVPSVPGRGGSSPGGSEPSGPVEVLRGTLGGDAQLEGGCTWLDTNSGERVQVLYPEGYEATADPVRLVGPDGAEIAGAGDLVEIEVGGRPDVSTICQVGPVVQATAVRPG